MTSGGRRQINDPEGCSHNRPCEEGEQQSQRRGLRLRRYPLDLPEWPMLVFQRCPDCAVPAAWAGCDCLLSVPDFGAETGR